MRRCGVLREMFVRACALTLLAGLAAAQTAPMPSFQGRLKRLNGQSIVLKLDDFREVSFKRTERTKFFKNGQELKQPDFKTGDRISVEGPLDAVGILTAVNVYWEKDATAADTESMRDEGVVDAWADEKPMPASEPKQAEVKPPARPDPDDPGPPLLRHGKPADAARGQSKPVPEQVPQTAARLPNPDDESAPLRRTRDDELIRKAEDAALDFAEKLPAYLCQQVVSRFESHTRPADWRPIDVVSAELVYENGKEQYRNVTVDGKPVKKDLAETGRSWSEGEFASTLRSLFSPATAAEFRYVRQARIAGINARQYTFQVARENSNWTVQMDSQTYRPAYSGAVWIDPENARILRIEMRAQGLPDAFPSDHVESATDWEYVKLGASARYLLPVHAEMLACQRGTNNCIRNVIDFRNYRRFEADSTITFDPVK